MKISNYYFVHPKVVKVNVMSLSHVRLFATPRTVAYHAPPSMGFSRQEYWSGLPFPSPGDLPDLGIEPRSLVLQADTLPSELPGKPNRVYRYHKIAHHPPAPPSLYSHCSQTAANKYLALSLGLEFPQSTRPWLEVCTPSPFLTAFTFFSIY